MPSNNRSTMTSALVLAALATGLGASSSLAAEKASKLEAIPGSDLKRVILTQKAAERLVIQTAPVKEEEVKRWLSVQGEVEISPEDIPVQTAAAPMATA